MINAPPRISRELLRPLSALSDVTKLLDQYRYFDSRLLIHRDPVYAYKDRAYWTAYNAGVDGRECEGSAWIGALHDPLPSGATVDVFKSWAQRRRVDPKRILLERRFKHPLITLAPSPPHERCARCRAATGSTSAAPTRPAPTSRRRRSTRRCRSPRRSRRPAGSSPLCRRGCGPTGSTASPTTCSSPGKPARLRPAVAPASERPAGAVGGNGSALHRWRDRADGPRTSGRSGRRGGRRRGHGRRRRARPSM